MDSQYSSSELDIGRSSQSQSQVLHTLQFYTVCHCFKSHTWLSVSLSDGELCCDQIEVCVTIYRIYFLKIKVDVYNEWCVVVVIGGGGGGGVRG